MESHLQLELAIHKLHFSPQVRYSEDIDLVQVEPGPVKPISERLSEVLSWLPRKTSEIRRFGFRMKFRYESEIAPIEPMRLKVEVNTFEHFSVLPLKRQIAEAVNSRQRHGQK